MASQNSGDANLCANNCGFFGNPATNNLCSKCYKEYLMKQAKELENSVLFGNKLGDKKVVENGEDLGEKADQEGVNDALEGVTEGSSSSSDQRPSNRCSFCKKRVGLTGFKCRCDQTFCSLHRYSDKHNCLFDYKGAGQDAIARANPVVKADKIEKI